MFRIESRFHRSLWIGLLAAVTAAACREDTTDPRIRSVTLSVAPAFQSTGAAGLVTVDRIQFVLVRAADESAVLDTIVDIPDGSEEIQVDLMVTVSSPDEVLLLTVTLFDPSGAVVFVGGPVEVTASVGEDGTPSPPIAVDLVYTGVGANAAAVRIVTADTSLFFGQTLSLTANAVDDQGDPIPGTPIGWSSVDPQLAQVPDEGVGQAIIGTTRGVARITATLLTGQADTTTVAIQAMPASIVTATGGGQRALPETLLPLPVAIQVRGSDALGVSDVTVTFATTDGSLATTTATTDAQGMAQTDWTLGPAEGPQTIDVALPDFPQVSGSVAATAVLPNTIGPTSEGQRGAVGSPVPARAQVLAADGLGVPGIQMEFRSAFGSVSPPNVSSDAQGFGQTSWTLGSNEGPQTIDVTLPNYPGISTTMTASAFVAPPPGTDIVVFNDMNLFDETAMQDPNNQLLVRNLVSFTGTGRSNGTVVWFDRGRNSTCFNSIPPECTAATNATMIAEIENMGLSVLQVLSDTLGAPSLDPLLKVVFLWNPTVPFTPTEIFSLQQFVAEGGRIVFIGEHDQFYPAEGIATENQFLLDMGAQMTNTGGAVDCGYNVLPASSILLGHQITTGLTGLTIACASVIQPGPQDFPIVYDLSNTRVLGAVARIAPLGAPPALWASPIERQRAFEAEVERIESRLAATRLDRTSASGVRP